MYLHLANYNVKDSYPLVASLGGVITHFEKETGMDYSIIEVHTIEDLLSIDAAARSSDAMYDGIFLKGNTIALLRNGETYKER